MKYLVLIVVLVMGCGKKANNNCNWGPGFSEVQNGVVVTSGVSQASCTDGTINGQAVKEISICGSTYYSDGVAVYAPLKWSSSNLGADTIQVTETDFIFPDSPVNTKTVCWFRVKNGQISADAPAPTAH